MGSKRERVRVNTLTLKARLADRDRRKFFVAVADYRIAHRLNFAGERPLD